MKKKSWTIKEDAFLINNLDKPLEYLILKLKRSKQAIIMRKHRLEISDCSWFSDEEDFYIMKNYKKMTAKEIGERLGRSSQSIYARALKLRLTTEKREWTEKEEELIAEIYQDSAPVKCTLKQKQLNRSIHATYSHAFSLGIKKLNKVQDVKL
jgi:hypothetical protein